MSGRGRGNIELIIFHPSYHLFFKENKTNQLLKQHQKHPSNQQLVLKQLRTQTFKLAKI
jgi:hypothetical protein